MRKISISAFIIAVLLTGSLYLVNQRVNDLANKVASLIKVGASQSISSLTELTSLSHNDVLPITEVNGLTTKKVKWGTATSSMKAVFDPLYSPIFSTSAGLAGLLSDETGTSGGFVRAGSPTITNATLSTSTLTAPIINMGGDANGDMYQRIAGAFGRVPIGTSGQLWTASSTGLGEWRTFDGVFSNITLSGLLSVSGTSSLATTSFSGPVTGVSATMSNFTASDAITAGNAVIIGDGASTNSATVSTGHGSAYGCNSSDWMSQKFTTGTRDKSIKSVTVWVGDSGANTVLTASIRANSAGQPTGSDIGGLTGTVNINTAGSLARTITFSTPIPVSASTDYHVIFRGAGTCNIYGNASSGQGTNSSANSGSTWSASNGALELSMTKIDTVAGQITPSSATNTFSSAMYNNFIGFASENISASGVGAVITGGVVTGLSGLTTGSTYYLSDTNGAISLSAGSNSRKVGIALSATSLLIKYDNP